MKSLNKKSNDVEPLSNRVRVCFFDPYPMGLGGNFQTQKLIIEKIDRKIFCPIMVSPTYGPALAQFEKLDVRCIVMDASKGLNSYGGKLLAASPLRRLIHGINLFFYNIKIFWFLKREKIDLVYTNCVRAQLSVGLGALLSGVPTVLYVKGELANPFIDFLALISAEKVMFFSAQNRDDKYPTLISWCFKKIEILRIGLDLSDLQGKTTGANKSLMEWGGIDPSFFNIAVVAQLYRPKGQHIAIEAFARLASEFPKSRLYFLGDHVLDEFKEYRSELEDLVRKYELTDRVFFLGWCEKPLAIINKIDILLHPSFAEGFGRAVLEAMALGKPVIASSVGALREAIVHGKNGYLTQPGDVNEIEKHLRTLISNPKLREKVGSLARRTVIDDYQIESKIQQLSDIWLRTAKRVA